MSSKNKSQRDKSAKGTSDGGNDSGNKEVLDRELYEKIDDEKINLGTRGLLSFSKEISPENAFFISPEDPDILKNVLLIHSSVTLLKQYLREVK